ncbi:MAG TPA: ABC transporter permease subunit [Steroidobacteraceae bacterium]|nr:ABC transporter permease subunit [Steroidobacteraceae bacterium]
MSARATPFGFVREFATRWDAVAIIVIAALIVFLAEASRDLLEPLAQLKSVPLSLDPAHLPQYAARTTLRMFAGLGLSLVFTLTYATWAAKSERAGRLLVPILDILQSVPILGFISITVAFFMSLVPGRVLGAELAAIFAIFTSQAWNMAFSFYQSLRTVPTELREAADSFLLSPWMRFWRLEVPFALPALVWNMMMSMSGGWFFVVASEAISVGHTTVMLPGIGSYIALAIQDRNLVAVGWAIVTMLLVILAYDQLVFRPLVAWIDRFRVEQEPGVSVPQSWALKMMVRSRLVRPATRGFRAAVRWTTRRRRTQSLPPQRTRSSRVGDTLWLIGLSAGLSVALWHLSRNFIAQTSLAEILQVGDLALLTMIRVFVLIAIASAIWVPLGVWIGLNPRAAQITQPIAQFLAAFPANLLFPLAVFAIAKWQLEPNIWLSPLMILGTQWYILFNVIAGASALPSELRRVALNLRVGGWLWWRKVALPGVFPYYLTGAITASGGSWNAAIVAELASWGNTRLEARGLGAYIADATAAADFHRVALGIVTMSVFVVTINRCFWRPLYYFAERKYRLS